MEERETEDASRPAEPTDQAGLDAHVAPPTENPAPTKSQPAQTGPGAEPKSEAETSKEAANLPPTDTDTAGAETAERSQGDLPVASTVERPLEGEAEATPLAEPGSVDFEQTPTVEQSQSHLIDGATESSSQNLQPEEPTNNTATAPKFVSPLSYLRPSTAHRSMAASPKPASVQPTPPEPESPIDRDQKRGLQAIRDFLKVRTSYDVTPLSFRLIVLDTDLLIKKSLNILIQNSIVSAPLWNSTAGQFAGLLTSTDYINVIQYYCQFPDEMSKLEQFKLSSLRDIERAIGAPSIETVSVHPLRPLYEACRSMLKTRARRIPLVDTDDETGRETVVSVITQYRILKFIAVNNERNTVQLRKSVREIGLGTYHNLATARMDSTVLDVVHLMVDHNISCVPIVDNMNRVLNAFEAVDIIPCIKGGIYEELGDTVGKALCKRPEDSPGIYVCAERDRLESIFDTVRKSRVHRLIVVDDDNTLKGVISLSDILKYVLLHGEEDES